MKSIVASRVASAFSGLVTGFSAHAQPWVTYDASLGTPPQAQCWVAREDVVPAATFPVGVVGADLHLSTLGLASTGVEGGAVYWQRTDVSIDFDTDFAVEARLRIAAAPNHAVNPESGWPRPGYTLAIFDVHGRLFWVGFGTEEIFVSNTSFGHYGTADTVTLAFNTTGYHVYRLERAAGGVGATLRIDGVPRLTLASLGPVENGGAVLYFGDPTYWTNSESYTSWVRYSGVGNGPVEPLGGPLSVRTCPATTAELVVTPSGTAPYTFRWEIEDPGAVGGWRTVADGPLVIDSVAWGTLAGTATATLRATPDPVTYPVGTLLRFRAVVANACGAAASDAATLAVRDCPFGGCVADYDASGGTPDSQDIDAFFTGWLGGEECADADCSGGTPDATDIEAFFTIWLAGGC